MLGFCLSGLAQDPDMKRLGVSEVLSLPVSEQTEVTVASNLITDRQKQPVSVTTITRDQLLLSGARTLSEALMLYVPGFFQVEDQDDLIMGFRGLAPDNNSKVMFLLNGQNLNTEFFWGPPDAILNGLDYQYIERIEVIRGPGSVTLGQGALLGVINIVTRSGANLRSRAVGGEIGGQLGANGYRTAHTGLFVNSADLKGHFYASQNVFESTPMRREGWAAQQGNQGFAGGRVADMGHHLRRAYQSMLFGNIQYKKLSVNLLRADQSRDLYNFYRDREIFRQALTSIGAEYRVDLSDKGDLRFQAMASQDDIFLSSLTGATMGGTRENRYGAKVLGTFRDVGFAGHRTAIGAEYRLFEMGRRNAQNNNFIANRVGSFDPVTANTQQTMAYQRDINVFSLFLEEYVTISPKLEAFAAVRYDRHPFWGSNLSPRIGLLASPTKDLFLRLSYQTGFRGAVGLHYSGGYRNDGHLRAENYSEVNPANIPGASNIPSIAPESMQSTELAVDYTWKKKFNFSGVAFYNIVKNIIDVGVFYQDPAQFVMPRIGSDIPGDWNGYWFFRNTLGSFAQLGFEGSLQYRTTKFELTASHAWVSIISATSEQEDLARAQNSMYLAYKDGLHPKAYPEHVSRLHAMYRPTEKLKVALTGLRYSSWFSPAGTLANGGLTANLAVSYLFAQRYEWAIIGRNLTNEQALYPMNSNAGGPDVSPGTPAWEQTSVWTSLRIKF